MSEAERLAEWHDAMASEPKRNEAKRKKHQATADELRRLSSELEECQAQRRAAFRRIEEQDKELEALKKAMGEPVAWLVTHGKTFQDRAFTLEINALNSQRERKDDCKVVPLYALTKDQS